MRLGFMPNLSEDVANKENAIVQVISGFNKFLKDKDYGRGIDELVISINCLNPAHEGKISCSPPEYLPGRTIIEVNKKGEQVKRTQNDFVYDLLPDHHMYSRTTLKAFKPMFALEVLRSLKVFRALPRPVPDFKYRRFTTDMREHITEKGWLQ